jgi:hypothetical protein
MTSTIMYEVEMNRLVPLLTPFFFGWTIFLSCVALCAFMY